MRIIVADDQPEVRSALKLLLGEKPGIEVINEASSSQELIAQVRSGNMDTVLLDWEIPGVKPRELIEHLISLCPQLSIVVLSSHPQVRKAALDAGARDFVCKSDPPETLLKVLDKTVSRTII